MKNLSKIIFSLTLSLTIGLLNSASSFAQSTSDESQPNTGYQSNEEGSSSSLGGSFNPFGIIHDMNFNRGSFNVEASNQNIDQQANDFKAIQQQRLLEMLNQNQNQNSTPNNILEETEDPQL